MELLTSEGMSVPFEVRVHSVSIDIAALDPLLDQMRAYADLPNPPEGSLNCKDCGRLQLLLDFDESLRNHQDSTRQRDQFYRQVFSIPI